MLLDSIDAKLDSINHAIAKINVPTVQENQKVADDTVARFIVTLLAASLIGLILFAIGGIIYAIIRFFKRKNKKTILKG